MLFRFQAALIGVGAVCLVSAFSMAEAQDRAGQAKRAQPAASQQIGASGDLLDQGDVIYQQARIVTERFGSVDVALDDGTALIVGPNSSVVIDRFVYDPTAATGETALQLGVGALRLVSGSVPAEQVRIGTPVATIGIRGTDFTLEAVGQDLLKIFVDEGTVTARTATTGIDYAFTAPAYAVCTASVCQSGGAGIKPRAFPPTPPGWSPSGAGGRGSGDSDGPSSPND